MCVKSVRNEGIECVTEKCVTTTDELTTTKKLSTACGGYILLFIHVTVSIFLDMGFLVVCRLSADSLHTNYSACRYFVHD